MIKIRVLTCFTGVISIAALHGQTVTSVANAASNAYAGLPNAAIAQGSLFVVYGSGMGPGTLTIAPVLPWPTTLAGTSLSVTVNGTTVKPFLYYTSANQLSAVLPSNTPVGTGTLVVTYNGTAGASAPIQVAASSFGIFAVNNAGSGPGIVTSSKYALAGLTNALNPGEAGIIWGTGLGAAAGDEAGGTATLAAANLQVKVYVGGTNANVVGFARSPGIPSEDQIAFIVPSGVSGCRVPVAVQTGDVVSNFVTMSIAVSGRTCSDTAGTSPVDISKLQQQGTVAAGSIDLSRSSSSTVLPPPLPSTKSTTDSGFAGFEKYTFDQYSNSLTAFSVVNFGACSVYSFSGQQAGQTDSFKPVPLDAGPSITISGPNGTKQLTSTAPGSYSATLGGGAAGAPGSSPLYLDKGTYTVTNGAGGANVGPFSVTINVPDALVWTNADSITNVQRSAGQLITWTGGDPSGNVEITGFAITVNGSSSVGAGFTCTARISDGQFTIPAVVLLSLPAGSAISVGGFSIPTGSLSVANSTVLNPFTATGLDYGYIFASNGTGKSVTYQ